MLAHNALGRAASRRNPRTYKVEEEPYGVEELPPVPDGRFANLPDFGFAPHYANVSSNPADAENGEMLRMHYLDEGPRCGRPILLLHGEPSWSFLYRKMVPHFSAAGFRSIVPDLIGFGRSEKLASRSAFSYQRHVAWLADFLRQMDLHEAVLVAQDWGGLLGLRLVAEHQNRFAAVVAANTFLPTGDESPNEAFELWRTGLQRAPEFRAGAIVSQGCRIPLMQEVVAAYDAPFPDQRYVSAAREFPMLVPTNPDDPASAANRSAWKILEQFQKPFLCAFSDGDPLTRGGDREFLKRVPGTRGIEHPTIAGAGHFLQEDKPDEFTAAVLDFLACTGLSSFVPGHFKKNYWIFADYFQFYLVDARSDWTPELDYNETTTISRMNVGPHILVVKPERNMFVPVSLEILESAPVEDFTQWDHVVEGSVEIASGQLGLVAVNGGIDQITVDPGCYRVRAYFADLKSISADRFDGDDHYKIALWPAANGEVAILKQFRREE